MANQWYTQNPVRYEDECRSVYSMLNKLNPKEVQLKDGRRGFVMTFKIPDPEGEMVDDQGGHFTNFRVLMAWNDDHPYSAASHYGGSVRTYFQSPTAGDLEQAYRAHGRPFVPHMFYDRHPVTGTMIKCPCTQKLNGETSSFTMVTAAALLANWLSAYVAGKYRESAYQAFCRD